MSALVKKRVLENFHYLPSGQLTLHLRIFLVSHLSLICRHETLALSIQDLQEQSVVLFGLKGVESIGRAV